MINLQFQIDASGISRFYPLIEKGYWTDVIRGTTIFDFLVKDLGLSAEYVETRIQTIFLNHKPIDDIAAVTLSENDRIAFSAAMPGLLGATMRKAGAYSAMRESISQKTDIRDSGQISSGTRTNVRIFVKFFNLIVKDIGADVLKKGICLTGEVLCDHLHSSGMAVSDKISHIKINNQLSSLESVFARINPTSNVCLTVRS